nr:MAG TPA: hypothetical protein [Caudoviricetes sp.]
MHYQAYRNAPIFNEMVFLDKSFKQMQNFKIGAFKREI